MPEPPETTELVAILERGLLWRDDRCSICLDRGVRDYILEALKQRSASR
jgi:hypothetical protein